MSSMFQDDERLTTLNLSSFHTTSATNMSTMFAGMRDLTTLDISNFDTSQVTDMSAMFQDDGSLTSLNLSHFNTSSVEYMNDMFMNTSGLTSLDLSSFNTSNVKNMNSMFEGALADNAILDLSSFNTSNVGINPGSNEGMKNMFLNSKVKTIYASSAFNTSHIDEHEELFGGNDNLVGGNGTAYSDSNPTTKAYAVIDIAGTPGYFTQK